MKVLFIFLSAFLPFAIHASPFSSNTINIDLYSSTLCAIDADGLLECKGHNHDDISQPPSSLKSVKQVSGGCAVLSNDTMRCWAKMRAYQGITKVPNIRYIDSHPYRDNICAITTDDRVKCWSDPTYHPQNKIVSVPSDLGPVKTISVGSSHVCAVKTDDSVFCWGENKHGQLEVPEDLGVISQLDSGSTFTCALNIAGQVKCWGTKGAGKQMTPPSNLKKVTQISTGLFHACALDIDSNVRCWGEVYKVTITPPGELAKFDIVQVTAGHNSTCVLTKDREVKCWGQSLLPFEEPKNVRKVVTSEDLICTIDEDAVALCWGENWHVSGPLIFSNVSDISIGKKHLCLVTTSGDVSCLGDNNYGKTDVPSHVKDIVHLEAGDINTCALSADGKVFCWGSDFRGVSSPPGNLGKVVSVSLYNDTACALEDTGTVKCWGRPKVKDFGDDFSPDESLKSIVKVQVGDSFVCTLNWFGRVNCTVSNQKGSVLSEESLNNAFSQFDISDISARGRKVCGFDNRYLTKSSVVCWSPFPNQIKDVPDHLGLLDSISTSGIDYACSVDETNILSCWGWSFSY